MMSVQEKMENARRAKREARQNATHGAYNRTSSGATDANGREITQGMWVKARRVKPHQGAWENIPVRQWEKKSIEEKRAYNVMYSNEHGNINSLRNHPAARREAPIRVHRTLS